MKEGPDSTPAPLLSLRGVDVRFPVKTGVLQRTHAHVHAVREVSLDLHAGHTLGLVGESGSGKSSLGRAVLRLVPVDSGTITYDGVDLTGLSGEPLRQIRRDLQVVFQDALASLNPRRTVQQAIREPLDQHQVGDPNERDARVRDLLDSVGLSSRGADGEMEDRGRWYPHELSGGQAQRVGIARAIATNPRLLILDEPVSALDVSIQAQIINLLMDLRAQHGLAYLFIAHDLSVVRHVSHTVAVMYLGRLVEVAPTPELFGAARHPYTAALLASAPPPPGQTRSAGAPVLQGEPPDPTQNMPGCAFYERCPRASALCKEQRPPLARLDGDASGTPGTGGGHWVACHHPIEVTAV